MLHCTCTVHVIPSSRLAVQRSSSAALRPLCAIGPGAQTAASLCGTMRGHWDALMWVREAVQEERSRTEEAKERTLQLKIPHWQTPRQPAPEDEDDEDDGDDEDQDEADKNEGAEEDEEDCGNDGDKQAKATETRTLLRLAHQAAARSFAPYASTDEIRRLQSDVQAMFILPVGVGEMNSRAFTSKRWRTRAQLNNEVREVRRKMLWPRPVDQLLPDALALPHSALPAWGRTAGGMHSYASSLVRDVQGAVHGDPQWREVLDETREFSDEDDEDNEDIADIGCHGEGQVRQGVKEEQEQEAQQEATGNPRSRPSACSPTRQANAVYQVPRFRQHRDFGIAEGGACVANVVWGCTQSTQVLHELREPFRSVPTCVVDLVRDTDRHITEQLANADDPVLSADAAAARVTQEGRCSRIAVSSRAVQLPETEVVSATTGSGSDSGAVAADVDMLLAATTPPLSNAERESLKEQVVLHTVARGVEGIIDGALTAVLRPLMQSRDMLAADLAAEREAPGVEVDGQAVLDRPHSTAGWQDVLRTVQQHADTLVAQNRVKLPVHDALHSLRLTRAVVARTQDRLLRLYSDKPSLDHLSTLRGMRATGAEQRAAALRLASRKRSAAAAATTAAAAVVSEPSARAAVQDTEEIANHMAEQYVRLAMQPTRARTAAPRLLANEGRLLRQLDSSLRTSVYEARCHAAHQGAVNGAGAGTGTGAAGGAGHT